MEAPLLPKSQKAGRHAQEHVLERGETLLPSRPAVFFNAGVEVAAFDEDTYLRILPYVLSWISVPLLVVAIVLFRPVTSAFIAILFLPSIIGTAVFFASLRPKLNKANTSLKRILLCLMIFACAQVLCDAFLALYVFLDGEYGQREDAILNRDVFIGASVVLCMAHVLVSLSLFTKFSILLWTIQT